MMNHNRRGEELLVDLGVTSLIRINEHIVVDPNDREFEVYDRVVYNIGNEQYPLWAVGTLERPATPLGKLYFRFMVERYGDDPKTWELCGSKSGFYMPEGPGILKIVKTDDEVSW